MNKKSEMTLDDLELSPSLEPEEIAKNEAEEKKQKSKEANLQRRQINQAKNSPSALGPLNDYEYEENGAKKKMSVSKALDEGLLSFGSNKGIGFVSEDEKLYKVGYKRTEGKGAMHVSWKGNLVMPKCISCGYRSSASHQINGECSKCEHLAVSSL